MPATSPEERAAILKAEHQRLEQYLSTLSPNAWGSPSTCDRWTVADVIAHITMFNRDTALRIIDSLEAEPLKAEDLPSRSNERVDAASMADIVIAFRKEIGDQLLPEFVKSGRAIEKAFDQVGPRDWGRLCYRRTGAEPIRNILDTYIADVGVHRWDVTYPFDPHVKLSQDCLAVMVERFPHRPRWWDIPLPPRHPSLPVRFRFEISDVAAPGTDFVIESTDEKYMEAAEGSLADVTFRCDAGTFVLLAYGRIRPETATAEGALTYGGSQEWAEIFSQSYIGG